MESRGQISFLIDTDTASDDAVALVIALRQREAEVAAITVVAGNVPLDQGVQNALYTVELCQSSVPVFAGARSPIARPLETAQFVHGEDGMGDIGLDLTGRVPALGDAIEVMIDLIKDRPGELILVTLGPLTNIALALQRAPEIAGLVKRCYVMGGTGSGPGNVTSVAEFNLWVDPEAASVVFGSGMDLTLVGWDISTRFATFSPSDAAEIRDVDTPWARFCIDIQATLTDYAINISGLVGFDLPDPITMAIALDPTLATVVASVDLRIETEGERRGAEVATHNPESKSEQVVEADRGRFLEMLRSAVAAEPIELL